jgi:hypothetical protein
VATLGSGWVNRARSAQSTPHRYRTNTVPVRNRTGPLKSLRLGSRQSVFLVRPLFSGTGVGADTCDGHFARNQDLRRRSPFRALDGRAGLHGVFPAPACRSKQVVETIAVGTRKLAFRKDCTQQGKLNAFNPWAILFWNCSGNKPWLLALARLSRVSRRRRPQELKNSRLGTRSRAALPHELRLCFVGVLESGVTSFDVHIA